MNNQGRPGSSSHFFVQQAPSSSTDHLVSIENAAPEVIHVVSVTQGSRLASLSQPHQVMTSLPNSNLQTITISGTNIGIPVNIPSGSNQVSHDDIMEYMYGNGSISTIQPGWLPISMVP